jgi:SMODS and SLOG-associating 2TM effector domain 1
MTVPNTAGSPTDSAPVPAGERRSAERGAAASPDGRRFASAAASPTAALEPILRSSSVRVQKEAVDHLERVATAQQRAFRRELTIANLCLMVAGVLSGLVLVLAPMMPSANAGWWAWLPRIMGVATLALGAIAALHTYKAREGNRLQRWLSARSGAEMARSGMFMTIAERAAGAGSELALAALELINRDLLENQRVWFRTRADEHRRSSDWTTSWGGLGTALAFVGGSGAVIASFVPDHTWIAVCGVIGAAVGAYAVNRESLRLDTANANGYEKAAAALDAIAARYDMVEAEVKAGKPEALRAFAAAITEQLSAEHKRWLEGSTQAEAVLGKLDNQLQRLNAQGPSSSPAGGNGAAGAERRQTDAASGMGQD